MQNLGGAFSLQPGITQMIAGQPQTPVAGENNLEWGIRSSIANALQKVHEVDKAVAHDVGKTVSYPFQPALAPPKPKAAAPAAAPARAFTPGGSMPSQGSQGSQMPNPASALTFNPMGGQITSQYRTPEHNAEVGGVQGSWHTRGTPQNPLAMDLVRPAGVSWGDFHESVRKGNPGMTVLREKIGTPKEHIHIEPPRGFQPGSGAAQASTGNPRLDAIQAAIGPPAQAPAPHEEGIDYARNVVGQQIQNVREGYTAQYPDQPMPEVPTPRLAQQVDYAKSDAAFDKATPKNPFGITAEEQEKAKLKMRRASYFSGIGGALANYGGGGLGQLFANMGGGALQGAMQGDENVRAKLEEFDSNMAKFNLAIANREEGKAKDFANIANANLTTLNRHDEQKYLQAFRKYDELKPYMDNNGRIVTKNLDPKTGMITQHATFIDPAGVNGLIGTLADLEIKRSALRTDADRLQFDANETTRRALIPYAIAEATRTGDYQTRDELVTAGATEKAYKLVQQGTWKTAMEGIPGNAEAARRLEQDANKAAGIAVDPKTGQPNLLSGKPTDEQLRRRDAYITSNLVGYFFDNGHIADLVGGFVQTVNPRTKERLPGTPERFYQNPLDVVNQSVQAFDAEHTKRSERETPKGTFGTEMYNPR